LVVNLPSQPFITLAAIWDKFARLFHGKLPLIKRRLTVYTSDDITDSKKIQEQLGYRPEISVQEGINRMAKAYKRSQFEITN